MIIREFDVEFTSPVCICDIEICNNIKDANGNWNWEKSDIVTFGTLYGNNIRILQREKKDELNNWKNALVREIENKPLMFSFNNKMERLGIKGFLGINQLYEEIQPACGSGMSKDNIFDDLVKKRIVLSENIPKDPFNKNSLLVVESYQKVDYESIIGHNKSCLIKEYFIFMNRFWFLKQYGKFLKNGWWYGKQPFSKGEPEVQEEVDDSDGMVFNSSPRSPYP